MRIRNSTLSHPSTTKAAPRPIQQTQSITVRLSASEQAEIAVAADQMDIAPSRLMRALALIRDPQRARPREWQTIENAILVVKRAEDLHRFAVVTLDHVERRDLSSRRCRILRRD